MSPQCQHSEAEGRGIVASLPYTETQFLKKKKTKSGMVAQDCLSSQLLRCQGYRVQSQPGLHGKTLSLNGLQIYRQMIINR